MVGRQSLANVDFSDDEEFDDEEYQQFINSSYGVCGVHVLAGHGSVTDEKKCGSYRGRWGCLNTQGHALPLQLQGEKSWEQVYQHPVFYSCHKWTCPRCFRSNVNREARRAEYRLKKAEERLGLKCEHVIASVPPERYSLTVAQMRALCIKALKSRGWMGGAILFHAFRLNRSTGYWFFSPHFHTLSIPSSTYLCRNCAKRLCSECHGFEWLTRERFERDGWIVKVAVDNQGRGVAGERRSIFDTLKYQLSHCSVSTEQKRSVVVTWYGTCSYRQLTDIKYTPKKAECPYCGQKLVKVRYLGSRHLCVDRESPDFKYESHEDLVENGVLVWEEVAEAMDVGG